MNIQVRRGFAEWGFISTRKGKQMSAKLIRFNMPFTIASSQLVWTKHALERKQQRGVVLPKGINNFDFVDYRWNDNNDPFPAMVLRHRKSDVVIVVTKSKGLYSVITCYWDNKKEKVG